jgi:hypothetical protein
MKQHRSLISINQNNYLAILQLDRELIGTEDYMGLAFFWDYNYRHQLRDASPAQRRRVHEKLRMAGYKLDGISDMHSQIIDQVCGK